MRKKADANVAMLGTATSAHADERLNHERKSETNA
jgi:hypothetical protein